MSLTQAKRALDKINALYKSMSLDEEDISSIERDLMMSYIRQLYEAFVADDSPAAPPVAKPKAPQQPSYQPPPEPAPKPEPVRYQPAKNPEPPAEPVRPTPPPRPAPVPPQPTYQAPTPPPQPQPNYVPTYSSTPSNPAVRALFDYQQAKELSEKLSQRPIEDLTKSMTINDRLLYANELFRGDQKSMLNTLDRLNQFRSMDQARPMLEDLATQNEWTDGEREETARSFIKLVRRRYN